MAEKYNGYTNRETWSASLQYDDILYEDAMAYIAQDRTFEQFKSHTERIIQEDVLRALREPQIHTLASELLCASLRAINYEELAVNAWEEAINDTYA